MLRENPCEIISIFIKADPQIYSEKYLEGSVFAFFLSSDSNPKENLEGT